MEVPKWFDSGGPRPCPCGEPPSGMMVLVETDDMGEVLFHEPCLARMIEDIDED